MKTVFRVSAAAAVAIAAVSVLSAQTPLLPSEPPRGFGSSITGAFEGWFENDEGGYSFLVGYLNRNRAQALDVPIGPANRIEPGGPDLGQPTHFLPGRHVGMFIVNVPKSFTKDQKLTWTITVNGQTTQIPLRLHPDYNVSPFKIAHGAPGANADNVPPLVRFEEKGRNIQGPIAMISRPALTRTATLAAGLPLTLWADDDARFGSGSNAPMRNPPPPVAIAWSKYRGPGTVTFEKPAMEKLKGGNVGEPFTGRFATAAKFSEPGEYLLHMTANDYSGDGGGGEVCCWTTGIVRVTVTQ
jgi:hypothetical protein